LSLDNFKKIQKILFRVHSNQTQISGLYIGVHAYFNQKFGCTNKTPFCEDKTNCPCKIKLIFRKARLDLDQFKSFGYEDLTISTKSVLDYGCLESILIPSSDKFEGFNPSINKAINLIQVEMMDYISIKTITCPSNFSAQNHPFHVMKLLPEDHKDFPCLFNYECETWDVKGNTQYQYILMRAQIQGYQWFFSDSDKREFDLIKETRDTKLFQPSYNGKFFIPFPVDHNNKLVQFF